MFEKRDTGHILLGQRIPLLTPETYQSALEERHETLFTIGQSPGAWLVAAIAAAEIEELHRFAGELGIIPEPEHI